VVFCRLVLCHLKEPEKAVAQMAALLRKGGRLVLVDMDLRDIFTMPACEHYPAFVGEAVIPLQAAIGVDYSVGLRLHELMADAGLVTDFVAADQPIFRTGPEKHLWEKTWRVAMPRAAGSGVIAIERAEALIAGMEAHTARPDVWMASAKMFAVVGTKAA
jgi:SAM-dependent methyltransferase